MKERTLRETKFYHGLITVILLIVTMFYMVVICGASPHMPLILGCVYAGIMALVLGYRWKDILSAAIGGITRALEAMLILVLIGVLVSVWIASGTVPTLICYGLTIVSPRFFAVTALAVCMIVSMALGSWGTAGTVGIAFMGIGTALGADPALTAGAIISGAYVGDILSPLSDATNLTAALVDKPVVEIVKHRFRVVLPVCGIACVLFYLCGLSYAGQDMQIVRDGVRPIIEGLNSSFQISPVCLLPLFIMLVCIIAKLPAIPSILAGIAAGYVQAMLVQGQNMSALLEMSYSGYLSSTGIASIDTLLSAGGITAMMYSVSVIMIAMAFGGIMQRTCQMSALMSPVAGRVRSEGGLTALSVDSCIAMNVLLADQYLGIAVPGQMYKEAYDGKNVDPLLLSDALGCGGAATSALVPWNTCGIYMATVLGVSAAAYIKYSFVNLLLPVGLILYSFARTWLRSRRAKK